MTHAADPIVRIDAIAKSYGTNGSVTWAVRGVSLEASAGELILLMGPSGSGKTTLLTMIAGLVAPTSGTVALYGRSLSAFGERERQEFRAKHIGFVFQNFLLVDSLDVLENVALVKRFAGTRTPIVFLQNVVTDLLLGLKLHPMLAAFGRYVKERYGAEPGYITMNLPVLVSALEQGGIENPIVCANINKIGFRMCGGVEAYREVLRSGRCRAVAMSVLASGAIPPREAIEWVCALEGLQSIVFGASSAGNIRQTKELIERAWGPRA